MNLKSLPPRALNRLKRYRWALRGPVLSYMTRQYVESPRSNSVSQSRYIALEEAVAWLYRSMDIEEADGSRCYDVNRGWSNCYPEVTGYNLYTLYDHAHLFQRSESAERATRMARWLLSVQLESGAYHGGYVGGGAGAVVFNTGQVIQGLVRAFVETQEEVFLEAAQRAGDWLVDVQDPDGAWRKFCYLDVHRVTDTRIAHPLAELWEVTQEERYRDSAERCLNYVADAQHENGWFPNCDNSTHSVDAPVTHTIAYTAEGLLKGGIILENERAIDAGRRAAQAMLKRFEISRVLHGRYDERWRPTVDWTCLTGCAQSSELWALLSEYDNDPAFLNGAVKMNDYLCTVQDLNSRHPGIRGGIAGSEPLTGTYMYGRFPSWACKYFCDALMMELKVTGKFS